MKTTNASESEAGPSRYVVGIDLGTTNSAVAYVDTADRAWSVRTFAVPQLVAAGQVEARETLPSFHYEAAEGESAAGRLALPWGQRDRSFAVGIFARDHGETAPGRLIASAKSWLCHPGIDRTAELLPWHPAADVERLSPVDASARYLGHIREAWDASHPGESLAGQDVVLTLPASFDEVARELTVKAAARAGLPRVVLLEEPQAAFYAWIDAHRDDWEKSPALRAGRTILVCDIGGGTTDFTLIRVRADEKGRAKFHRVAVGDHLILGGDNLDLALAHHVEQRLVGEGKLAPRQWSVLVQTCRRVKETLLGASPPERMVVSVPGTGARLIGGSLQVELVRDEVQQVLVEGFLPRAALDEKPAARRSGFQEFGLPYAPDAAITRYLSAFLTAHRHVLADEPGATTDHDPARPDVVLFNGGFFESPLLRERLLEVLCSWFSTPDKPWRPVVLENERLDLAVARGAAYYGMVRRGQGVRISAGLARSYYIGVEGATEGASDRVAVCLVPAGVEEGQSVDLKERTFRLLIRQPVEFPLFVSSLRLTDRAGELVPIDREQISSLPPIRTVLQSGKKGAAESLAVQLHARLTEIGTLDVWCSESGGPRTWRLQFDVRAATQTDRSGHRGTGESEGFVDEAVLESCRQAIRETFDRSAAARRLPDGLMKLLEEITGVRRAAWPSSMLRNLWETMLELEAGRAQSAVHEARWLYLVGFSLRPGYGMAVDDWRVAQTWRLFQGKKVLHAGPMCQVEWLILWRRIAGGLAAGQQRAIAEPLWASIRLPSGKAGRTKGRGAEIRFGPHELAEVWRLLGSLELLGSGAKTELGNLALDGLGREKTSAVQAARIWALGRLGARTPLYGPLNTVVPTETVEAWLSQAMNLKLDQHEPILTFAVVQMARRTGDRYRDMGDKVRQGVLRWLAGLSAPEHYRQLVSDGGELESAEQGLVFGESLPQGLRLH